MLLLLTVALGCDDRTTAEAERETAATAADRRATTDSPRAEDLRASEAMRGSIQRLLDDERPADALAVARSLAQRSPDDWTAHELHGRAAAATALMLEEAYVTGTELERLRREAADAYDESARLATTDAVHAAGHLLRAAALMYEGLGETTESLARYDRAATIDPLDAQTPLFAAQAHLRRGDLAAAKVLVDRVLALDPDEAWGWATRAEIERQSGDSSLALQSIRRGRRLDPTNHVLRLREARLLRLLDRPADGLTLLMTLPPDERASVAFVEEIAESWERIGEPDRSAEAWEDLARRHPDRWRYALEASRWWLRAADAVRAGVALEAALLLAADDPDVITQRDAIGHALRGATPSDDELDSPPNGG